MPSNDFLLPSDCSRVKVVDSFEALISTAFENGVNALCWRRALAGDFREVVERLAVGEGITSIDDELLERLELSAAGQVARNILLQDQELLRSRDLLPSLDCIRGDVRDLSGGPVPTDVYSWHVDSATVLADTYLCSYTEAASEGLPNEDAVRRVDMPATRAELLEMFGGKDDDDFREFLVENFYDLHYVPMPQARPYSFGLGNLWRIATECPDSPVPPCIHRAPAMRHGQFPRLLLIS